MPEALSGLPIFALEEGARVTHRMELDGWFYRATWFYLDPHTRTVHLRSYGVQEVYILDIGFACDPASPSE